MTSTARTGRRRRMLHEGAPASTAAGGEPQPATHRRYTPREGSVSFAIAGALLPRSPVSMMGCGVVGVAIIAGLVWLDGLAAASALPTATARVLQIDQPGGLAKWYEGSLWLAVAVQSVLLFGLRKHRTNDTGSAYRWWLLVAGVALGMSLSAATQAHGAIAGQLAALAGFSPLASDAFWWLVPGGVVLTGVAVRSWLEVRESRVAAVAGLLAVGVTVVAWVASAGLLPAALGEAAPWLVSPLLAHVASLAGVSLLLLTLVGYSRRIVRETLGELEPPKPASKPSADLEAADAVSEGESEAATPEPAAKPPRAKRKAAAAAEPAIKVAERTRQAVAKEEPELVPTAAKRRAERKRAAAKAPEEDSRWVSGPEGDDDYGDEGSSSRRKLTKAERKRMRREKERRAA